MYKHYYKLDILEVLIRIYCWEGQYGLVYSIPQRKNTDGSGSSHSKNLDQGIHARTRRLNLMDASNSAERSPQICRKSACSLASLAALQPLTLSELWSGQVKNACREINRSRTWERRTHMRSRHYHVILYEFIVASWTLDKINASTAVLSIYILDNERSFSWVIKPNSIVNIFDFEKFVKFLTYS